MTEYLLTNVRAEDRHLQYEQDEIVGQAHTHSGYWVLGTGCIKVMKLLSVRQVNFCKKWELLPNLKDVFHISSLLVVANVDSC